MTKVMLVEDDNNLREIYEARLQAEGYEIVTAKDGEEALVVAKAEHPELIISDVMMPKISGFEMLDILRNTDGLRDVKVIMLTALGQSDDQERADKLGADRYLVKSQVTLEDIVKVAHDLIDGETPSEPAVPVAAAPDPALAAIPVVAVSDAATTTDDKIMQDAVDTLLASTDTPVAPAPEPITAPAPEPVAEPIAIDPAPISVAAPAPEPAQVATVTENDAQTTAQEEASVEARIEDFVAGATSESPAPAPLPQPEITPALAVEPAAVPAVEPAAVPVAEPATVPTPEPSPQITQAAVEGGSVPISGKKVISPIAPDPKQNLNVLLAAEDAKDIAAGTAVVTPVPVAPNTVVSPPADPNAPDPNSIAL